MNPATPEFDLLPDHRELPFIPLDAVWPHGLDLTQRRTKSQVTSGYTRLREGDILVPKITPTFQADRTVIAEGIDGGVAAGTTELHIVRAPSQAATRYVRYLLSSRDFLSFGEASMIGVAGQRRVPEDCIKNLDVPIRDLDAQRRIADFLDVETTRIDALIAKKRRMIDLMRERRSSVYRAAAAGLPLSAARAQCDLPWLDDLPVHWSEAKLVRLARLGSGHTPSRERPDWWENCTIPWITTGEVAQIRGDRIDVLSETREMISELGLANSSVEVHPAGTVVLSRTASAGFSAIMGTDMATSQDFVTWTCGEGLNPRFLLICLRAMRQDLLERLAMGSTHKTIYMPDIASIRVPVPPIDEQDEMVRWVDAQLARVSRTEDALARQIELLQEHRQALITQAVTGRLPIPA